MEMPTARPSHRPRPARPLAIAVRLVLYLSAAWGTLTVLSSGLVPWAGGIVSAVAIYTTVPLIAFMRWRGWPFYPGKAFRLLVVRPFWYAQLMLPLASAAGLIGLLVGSPFGHGLTAGRVAAGVAFTIVGATLLLGYFGAGHLVVRRVDVEVPGLASEFDGLRIAQLSDLHVGPHTSRRFLRRIVEATGKLSADLIAVTGDLVDDRSAR